MLSICKQYTFAAAHFLPNHSGKCRNLHGHNYRVEVEVTGTLMVMGSSEGMVMDFSTLDSFVDPLIRCVDHTLLNDVLPVEYHPPTAENVAVWFRDRLPPNVSRIRVWETDKAYAEWTRE